jgi:hypothetical protein
MDKSQRLIDFYLPPAEGFILESLVATTYQVDFAFLEEDLLARALGVRSPVSRLKAFRSELERRLQTTDVSVLYDLKGCERLARLSPRVDAIPVVNRKLHAKITLLMWVRNEYDGKKTPDRLMRLIVGSANLTRQGFRENYECVSAIDYGNRSRAPRSLLMTAIRLIRQIGANSASPQLAKQLESFQTQTNSLAEGEFSDNVPVSLVTADQALTTIWNAWAALTDKPPAQLMIVSPFWPEGKTAAKGLADLLKRFQSPSRVELVCRGTLSADGRKWLPEFDADVATNLNRQFDGRLFLRPALPNVGVDEGNGDTEETGDETEEHELTHHLVDKKPNDSQIQRPMHAKMIVLDGSSGSILYTGSSNCTRRGLGLGGATNWEAGFVYRLTPNQRKRIQPLFAFAGTATEVLPDQPLETVKPSRQEELSVPSFLSEIKAVSTTITITFREGVPIPNDLIVLMEIPSRALERVYWMLYSRQSSTKPLVEIVSDLGNCQLVDANLSELPQDLNEESIQPHVFVEVRWQGQMTLFPVRFDDKATLPLRLVGRKPTEGELIDYFLFGRDPDDGDGGNGGTRTPESEHETDGPIDTRRILAYFIRRFIQAIPGIEAEIQRASYSHTALEATLRGPTSPLELAERAFASLTHSPSPDEPVKTATAVGFQLTEILAALLRCQAHVDDTSLKACFDHVIARCRELIGNLVNTTPELRDSAFQLYLERFVGESR